MARQETVYVYNLWKKAGAYEQFSVQIGANILEANISGCIVTGLNQKLNFLLM